MSAVPTSTPFSSFLLQNKQQYLSAVQHGSARHWTVVMGNEAGDLDSVASALAYSWFESTVHNSPTVALIQTARNDLRLRPENLYALELAELHPGQHDILCSDDIPASTPFPSHKFALVDHNRLQSAYAEGNPGATVTAIIDHHKDEGFHSTADPRIIEFPMGSCTSLVARLMAASLPQGIPKDIATLLLCGLLVDTDGLKVGGKAEQVDREAAAYLLPHSSIGGSVGLDDPALLELSTALSEKKNDVAHLPSIDLVRRDYKEYEWTCAWAPSQPTIRVGLSTVPLGLRSWLPRDGILFWESMDGYMADRGLAVLAILTTFHDEEKLNKNGKGKHKRQMLLIVSDGALEGGTDALEARLWSGLEQNSELKLERRDLAKYEELDESNVGSRRARAYKQGNAKATRKIIAPIVQEIIEGA